MSRIIPVSDRKLTIFLHAIAWIIVISIPLYLSNAFSGGNTHRLYQFYVHSLSAILIFYAGYLWLIPRFFLRDRKFAYLAILLAFILFTYFVTSYINEHLLFNAVQDGKFQEALKKFSENGANERAPMRAFGFYNHLIASVLISGFALGLGVMEKLKENEKKQKELEKEKLNSELAFLKNQVSPHFFFNTLNNIYSLIGLDGPAAQESVLKLSKLMRYLLYESEHGETLISHEINFMNNYIDLMKLRLNSKVDLQIDFPGQFTDFNIPPLLFIPFIENAFKHGVSFRENAFIRIRMTIDSGKIVFTAENSLGKGSQPSDMHYSGIGLDNVRKRLNLLFPGKHELNISKDDTAFRVQLSIEK
jgi:sensor histidine kinase YesM